MQTLNGLMGIQIKSSVKTCASILAALVKHREVFCSPLVDPISLGKYLDTGMVKCVNVSGEMAPKSDIRPTEYE